MYLFLDVLKRKIRDYIIKKTDFLQIKAMIRIKKGINYVIFLK